MKKVLLATTMLVAGASIAAAEVTLSGTARMGLFNDFVFDPTEPDSTTFTSRARVQFNMAGESDSGLSFGASFRADNAADANDGTGGNVFISGAFGTLSMGDVDGAANAAVGQPNGVGLTGLGDRQEMIFIANGGFGGDTAEALGFVDADGEAVGLTGDPSALYTYTAGSLSLYASATLPGHVFTFDDAGTDITVEGEAYGLGAAYTIDSYKVSLGYEVLSLDEVGTTNSLDMKHIILGADATFGAIGVQVRYGKADIEENNVAFADLEQATLAATYTMDAVAVTGFYAMKDLSESNGTNIVDSDSYGLGVSYDLGGGASMQGGIVRQKGAANTGGAATTFDDTAFDVGVSFTF